MGAFFISTFSLIGLEVHLVRVETDISQGLPKFTIVGLPDTAISESRERIRSSIRNAKIPFPRSRITINLAPADTKKQGPSFDLPIALSLLVQSGQLKANSFLKETIVLGELSLNGEIRPIQGALLAAQEAKKQGYKHLIVPEENVEEANIIDGITVYGAKSLTTLILQLQQETLELTPKKPLLFQKTAFPVNFSDIKGQEQAKRALEIAAAGGHNLLLVGPPGSGKTLLARALPSILPSLTKEEAIEVLAIKYAAGEASQLSEASLIRPFRSPHHTASPVSLVGGGGWPKPGEVSLAHRGVLFLDELPEFSRKTLESLRQPMENGVITVSRSAHTNTFPARFSFIGAMNPCPCGYATDPEKTCLCTPHKVQQYQQKISGPVLDRIDLIIHVPRVTIDDFFSSATKAESSQQILQRVIAARDHQLNRYNKHPITTNAELSLSLFPLIQIEKEASELLLQAAKTYHISARVLSRIQKVARTIADLEGSLTIKAPHVREALFYRPMELFL